MADDTFRSVVHCSISTRRHDRIEAYTLGSIRCGFRALTVSSRLYNLSGGAHML